MPRKSKTMNTFPTITVATPREATSQVGSAYGLSSIMTWDGQEIPCRVEYTDEGALLHVAHLPKPRRESCGHAAAGLVTPEVPSEDPPGDRHDPSP